MFGCVCCFFSLLKKTKKPKKKTKQNPPSKKQLMFLRLTEVFRIPRAFYMIFVGFLLFRRGKGLEHNHFYWIKFAVHERLSCSHVQALTITSCALRVVLEKRKEGEISKNKRLFLTWIEKCACFLLNTTNLREGWQV